MMKRLVKLFSIGLMAFAIAGLPANLQAQNTEGSAASKKDAAVQQKKLPFNGTLKAIDKKAGTVKVGNRTFKLTSDTKYLQGGLETAKIGEKVGGSYWKAEDGTLTVNSIRFGPKPDKKEKKAQKEKSAEQ